MKVIYHRLAGFTGRLAERPGRPYRPLHSPDTMKIIIEKQAPDAVQEFFSAPLTFDQKVTVKKLLIFERILERMKVLCLNRTQLAAKMGISSARVTTMMDGTNHFTIETLMRAAEAVDAEFEMTLVPKDHKIR